MSGVSVEQIKNIFSGRRIFLAVSLGVLVSAYLAYRGYQETLNTGFQWAEISFSYLFIAILLMIIRDFAYMLRLRVLTDRQLGWRQCFEVIMLWEFASSLTPSVVGGSGLAIFIINQEKIHLGKSTAIVMVTAFLDELFYVLMVPVILFITGMDFLFPVSLQKNIMGLQVGTQGIFFIGYAFILLLIGMIFYGLFVHPRGVKKILLSVFKVRWLRKWRYRALETSNNLILTSYELKGKSIAFWLQSFGYTFFSWTARFWVVNFILMAFNPGLLPADHFLIYARQLVMWVILLISPTPGGSGIAEFAFSGFLEEFSPDGLAGIQATLWRLFSYYPYLIVGSIVLPVWLRRIFKQ